MRRKPLLILHFRELEKYPPTINFINKLKDLNVEFKFCSGNYRHYAINIPLINYFIFFIRAMRLLFFYPESNVFYYESISSIPLRLFYFFSPCTKRKLFIHFHEYFNHEEYKMQSRLERIGRICEKHLFNKAVTISHTNWDRLNLFQKEFPNVEFKNLKVLPNYPPKSWLGNDKIANGLCDTVISRPLKLVHIGAISLQSMFLKEALEFFGNSKIYSIDFYSHNFSKDVIDLIASCDNCKICGSINYNQIPVLKDKYDGGLVLYNGSSNNFIYNAPNKVFEYLALNMDVICSSKLVTVNQYVCNNTFPRIIMVDFNNLFNFDFVKLLGREGLVFDESPYFCDNIYSDYINVMND